MTLLDKEIIRLKKARTHITALGDYFNSLPSKYHPVSELQNLDDMVYEIYRNEYSEHSKLVIFII